MATINIGGHYVIAWPFMTSELHKLLHILFTSNAIKIIKGTEKVIRVGEM